jgi:PAS domain S-box-containing protein
MEGLGDMSAGVPQGRDPRTSNPFLAFLERVDMGFCVVELVRDDAGRAVDHRIVYANPGFELHTGLVDVEGKRATELVSDLEASWHEAYAEVAASGAPLRFERYSAALQRWFDVFVAPFGEDSRQVAVLFNDITAKKRVERELAEGNHERAQLLELLQTILDNAPGTLWAKDAEGRLLLTNTHLEWLLGVCRQELRGKNAYDLFPKEAADVVQANDTRAAAGEVLLAEETVPTPHGPRTYLSSKFPVTGPATLPAVVAGFSVDITERKHAEEQLRRSEARLRTIIETNVIGVTFWSDSGRLTFANDALLGMLGASREEVEAGELDWRRLTPPEHAARDADFLVGLRQHGTAPPFEKEFFRKDGSRVPVLIAAAAFPDDVHSGVAFVVDLTAQKRTQLALQEQIAFEERLVGIVGHDLRNPLSSSKLHLALLLRSTDLPAAARQRLQRLAEVLQVMERIVNDLLDLARIRADKGLPIQTAPFCLSELCQYLVEEAGALFPEALFRFEVPGRVMGSWDRTRLSQAVMNLLVNAVKHGEPGRPIQVRVSADGDSTSVAVHNFGRAIPAGRLATLFDPYVQGDSANTSMGLGLGLYIVREIARAHGGDVRAESSEEAGTTFTLTVPRAPVP